MVFFTSAIITFLQQPIYQSCARIEVYRAMSDISGELRNGAQVLLPPSYDPYFIQKECGVIESKVILTNVIQKLDLNRKWGAKYNAGTPFSTQQTLRMLRAHLDVFLQRGTQVIEIRASSSFGGADPEPSKTEARDIANQIVDSYKAYRLDLPRRQREAGIESMKRSLASLDQNVKTAQSNVDNLSVALKVTADDAWLKDFTNQQQIEPYFAAKRTLMHLQETQRLVEMRIQQEIIELQLPRQPVVKVIQPAELALRSCRPNWTVNLTLGFIVGGLAGFGCSGFVFLLQRQANSRSRE
jgi:uncharacterized protein involved in exopolysaccharide biosynthesis